MKSYEEMLGNLYEKLPKKTQSGERFEAPHFQSFIEGRQTVISNFTSVAEILRMKVEHLLKFISKELATPASLEGKRVLIQGKFKTDQLNARLKYYIDEYIMCNECHRPDTALVVFESHKYKQCEGCGARSPVRVL